MRGALAADGKVMPVDDPVQRRIARDFVADSIDLDLFVEEDRRCIVVIVLVDLLQHLAALVFVELFVRRLDGRLNLGKHVHLVAVSHECSALIERITSMVGSDT